MSTVTYRKCYLCHGVSVHLPHCPEMMDEVAKEKMFPGRKRDTPTPAPPTTPSKSTHTRVCAHLNESGHKDCYNSSRLDVRGSFCIECAKKEGLI